jgi:hypothetical protein
MLFNPLRVGQRALVAALLASAAPAAFAQHSHQAPPSSARAVVTPDPPGTHGMLLFGRHALYASHLPMFHRPHDYQVLLELELSGPAQAAYAASLGQYPQETVYTLDPEKFVLPDMVAHPRPFQADVYRGHFERGGTRIASGATVRIRRVVYFRPLLAADAAPAHPTYIVLGNSQEQFLAHRIAGQPDYDQVLRVTLSPAGARQLTRLGFLTWQADTVLTAPLARPGKVWGSAAGTSQPLRVEQPLYLEFDDLR